MEAMLSEVICEAVRTIHMKTFMDVMSTFSYIHNSQIRLISKSSTAEQMRRRGFMTKAKQQAQRSPVADRSKRQLRLAVSRRRFAIVDSIIF